MRQEPIIPLKSAELWATPLPALGAGSIPVKPGPLILFIVADNSLSPALAYVALMMLTNPFLMEYFTVVQEHFLLPEATTSFYGTPCQTPFSSLSVHYLI